MIAAMVMLTAPVAFATGAEAPSVVVVATPERDGSVFDSLHSKERPLDSAEAVRRSFPAAEFVVVEEKGGMLYVFDRELPAIKLQRNRIEVLQAFLKHQDDLGIVRLGDLSRVQRAAALELLGGGARLIEVMGVGMEDVRVALETSFYLVANSPTKSVEARAGSGLSIEDARRLQAELIKFGVDDVQLSRADLDRLNAEFTESARRTAGFSIRYLRVNKFDLSSPTERAMSVLHEFLLQTEHGADELHWALEQDLTQRVVPEYGSGAPRSEIPRNRVPAALWNNFESSVRMNSSRQFANDAEEDTFLASVTSVKIKVEFLLSFAVKPYTDDNGQRHSAVGRSVLLIRR